MPKAFVHMFHHDINKDGCYVALLPIEYRCQVPAQTPSQSRALKSNRSEKQTLEHHQRKKKLPKMTETIFIKHYFRSSLSFEFDPSPTWSDGGGGAYRIHSHNIVIEHQMWIPPPLEIVPENFPQRSEQEFQLIKLLFKLNDKSAGCLRLHSDRKSDGPLSPDWWLILISSWGHPGGRTEDKTKRPFSNLKTYLTTMTEESFIVFCCSHTLTWL